MMRFIHRSRRRVMLTVLFIVLGTVSMIGPTQAVSGIVTASVAVTETFAHLVGSVDRPKPKPTSAPHAGLAEWFDAAFTPDFPELVGTLPPQAERELAASVDAMPALTNAGAESNSQADPNGFGGRGGSRQGGRAAPSGSGLSGVGGGNSPGSFADTPAGRELAAMDLALESPVASLIAGALDTSIESIDDASSFDPAMGLGPNLGPGVIPGGSLVPPGSSVADSGSNPTAGFPIPDIALTPPHTASTPSTAIPSVAGGPTTAGAPPGGAPPAARGAYVPAPSVMEDLLEKLGIPAQIAADLDPLRTASATSDNALGVVQVPEPSVMLLGAVGMAAVARRRRRTTADRRQ